MEVGIHSLLYAGYAPRGSAHYWQDSAQPLKGRGAFLASDTKTTNTKQPPAKAGGCLVLGDSCSGNPFDQADTVGKVG